MLDYNTRLRIVDLGITKDMNSKNQKIGGTLPYFTPNKLNLMNYLNFSHSKLRAKHNILESDKSKAEFTDSKIQKK